MFFNHNNIAFLKGCTFAGKIIHCFLHSLLSFCIHSLVSAMFGLIDNTCDDDGGALYLNYDNILSVQDSAFTSKMVHD